MNVVFKKKFYLLVMAILQKKYQKYANQWAWKFLL